MRDPDAYLRRANPALSFAKLRSDKNHTKHPRSGLRADSLHSVCRLFGGRTCVMFTRLPEARVQDLRRLCSLFADRTQEGDEQTGLGRTRQYPVLWIADERADKAESTRPN